MSPGMIRHPKVLRNLFLARGEGYSTERILESKVFKGILQTNFTLRWGFYSRILERSDIEYKTYFRH